MAFAHAARLLLALASTLPLTAALGAGGCVTQGTLPHHYEDPDHMIKVFDDPERDAWAKPDEVVHALRIEDPATVIADIGAGSGYFSRRLASQAPAGKVYAVDVDDTFETHIEQNRERWGTPNIEPHLAFYDDPALPNASIDLIFMSNTYPYIRDRVTYLRKIKAALKPGGRLVVISFRNDAQVPGDAAPPAKHRVPKDTAILELKEAGFVLEREETFLPYQYFLILQHAP